MEETKAGISSFHGGFGLINNNGLKKPSYFAYYLLSKLGTHIIDRGEDYILTKTGDDFQLLAYNFAYFDELFMSGDTSALTYLDRYKVFQAKKPIKIEVNISGVPGSYKKTQYELNREHGSVFDKWLELGSPENMIEEEAEYLKRKLYPRMFTETVEIRDTYNYEIMLPVHGIQLTTFHKLHV